MSFDQEESYIYYRQMIKVLRNRKTGAEESKRPTVNNSIGSSKRPSINNEHSMTFNDGKPAIEKASGQSLQTQTVQRPLEDNYASTRVVAEQPKKFGIKRQQTVKSQSGIFNVQTDR